MIKLFWNTHNLKKTITNDEKVKEEEINEYKWGLYHRKNSSAWMSEILGKIKYENIDNEKELKEGDTLIIVDSNPEKKIELYNKLSQISSKILLFHLGDEASTLDMSQVYNRCYFVFRTFCSSRYFNTKKIKCIPIGYKTGLLNKQKNEREYKWAFTGTIHKSSRHDLLFQLSNVKPFFCHKTEKFDEKIISVEKMSEVLSSTEFMPCPNGFVHPETYRLYEALQCGCIPIVENSYKYYDRLFPGNPFIKVDKWSEAKPIIKEWDSKQIKQKKKDCEIWWNNYKTNLQETVKNKISS